MSKKNPKLITKQKKSEVSKKNPKPDVEQVLIDGNELAKMIGMTPRWVELNRHKIIGAQRVGGLWRYNLYIISSIIASGKNIVVDN
jgi:hypothetical protein